MNVKIFILIIAALFLPVTVAAAGQADAITEAYPKNIFLPVGDLFKPLIADPKQPRFFVSFRKYEYKDDIINGAAVGFGENFGLYKRQLRENGDGYQVNVAGALLAQFNLDAASSDLVNADYIIGFPFTYRSGSFSGRLNIYHQSSHLGDEFLINAKPERVNLSYESLDLLLSYEWKELRGYLGGEYLLHRDPGDLDPGAAHGGIEYYSVKRIFNIGRLIGGLDLKSYEEHDWSIDAAVSIGLELGQPDPGQRRVRIMFDGYKGYAPHGQFYNDRISYYGLGLYLGF